MIQFAYSGDETIVSSIEDLDLLFELYCLADKVGDAVFWIRIKESLRVRLTDFAGSDPDPSYLHLKNLQTNKMLNIFFTNSKYVQAYLFIKLQKTFKEL